MKRLSLALLFLLLLPIAAWAQAARVVSACGATAPFGPLNPGSQVVLQVDTTGTLCAAGGGGGGGSGLPSVGNAALATGQTTIPTTAGGTQIVPARTGAVGTGRHQVTITNLTGSDRLCVGNTGLTTANGYCMPAVVGATVTLDVVAAVFGIVATTPQAISFVETY